MRILAIAILLGSAVLAANPLTSDLETTADANQKSSSVIAAGETIDPIVTGQTISKEDISEWEAERKRYLECPDCETKQAFPGD